ncbi:MAG: hypothetical protein EOP85_02695 [Verrucomicrobiaceae bacterium]|nr:MAG: hypothetical protein EOP85_02695 [Verrucomicrobiaceae bacterium]
MLPTERAWLRMLRLGLILSSCGWGISFFFTFAPWEMAADQLYDMGATPIAYDPLVDYWLRMASCAFGCIGIASALACVWPARFTGLISLLGPFNLIVGTTLAFSAWRNQLDPQVHSTFIPDITFCFLTGFLISGPLLRERFLKSE